VEQPEKQKKKRKKGPRRFREFLKWLLSPVLFRIKAGPLQGKRWIATAGMNFYNGVYELEKTAVIEQQVKAGDVTFDVGAHVGYFTVLMSQLVGPGGKVFAFEPRPINHSFLSRHVRVNDCRNVIIRKVCIGDRAGPARLDTHTGTGTGKVSPTGNLAVDMIHLDSLVASGELPVPQFIKVDVEGGEMMVLRGIEGILRQHRPRLLIATHSDALETECRAFLDGLGYGMDDIGQLKGDKEHLSLPRA
jgi:FkbM family methyltransferase